MIETMNEILKDKHKGLTFAAEAKFYLE